LAGNIQNFIAPRGIIFFFDNSGHVFLLNKPTVGLLIRIINPLVRSVKIKINEKSSRKGQDIGMDLINCGLESRSCTSTQTDTC
jgi:hypothetical protein